MQCECGSKKISHIILDPDWRNPRESDFSKTEVYECEDCGKEINLTSSTNSQDED